MKPNKILCPVDFSPCSDVAVEHAITLAKCFEAKLVVVHIDEPPPTYAVGYAGYASVPPYEGKQDTRLEELVIDPSVDVEREHLVGVPDSVIVRHAQEADCDLIVMGTHGRGAVAKLVLGSVAQSVLRHAKCPVIVVRDAARERTLESKTATETLT